jgi:hypothetical protein
MAAVLESPVRMLYEGWAVVLLRKPGICALSAAASEMHTRARVVAAR